MSELYRIATDPEATLEDRYAAIRIMQRMRTMNPKDYKRLQQKAEWQRKYNAGRKDYREYIKQLECAE